MNQIGTVYLSQLSEKEFETLSAFIYNNFGIKMPKEKRIMLQSRLQKRLKALNMNNFKDYIEYVFSGNGNSEEVIYMMDEVSTNKTDFFREPAHFEYLNTIVLPELMKDGNRFKKIKIWSAGCSSGEEVYTLAIVMSEAKLQYPGLDFDILGTDLSTKVLQNAAQGIYKDDRVFNIPINLKKKYFLKSKDPALKQVRLTSEIRNKVKFGRLNFMDPAYGVNENFDIVFCRNVLIYFDRTTQEKVINKLCKFIPSGGYFFLGHSESITNIDVPLKQIKPTFFMKI